MLLTVLSAHPASGPRRSAFHLAFPFSFSFLYMSTWSPTSPSNRRAQIRGRRASPSAFPSQLCCETIKWNPSEMKSQSDPIWPHTQAREHSVAAVHNHVSMYRATSPYHCRSEVIGWGLPVESCWYGRKIFTSFKLNLQLLPKMCSSHIIFWKTVNPFDGHDLKLNLS